MFRTFSKQVRKKAGELTFLITLTVPGLNFVLLAWTWGEGQAKIHTMMKSTKVQLKCKPSAHCTCWLIDGLSYEYALLVVPTLIVARECLTRASSTSRCRSRNTPFVLPSFASKVDRVSESRLQESPVRSCILAFYSISLTQLFQENHCSFLARVVLKLLVLITGCLQYQNKR